MERFWSKVNNIEGGCWEWTAAFREPGYGAFKFKGKTVDAHRVSYELSFGSIPVGLLVCHECDNRKCVNPDHLFLGTHQDNYDDAISKGRVVKMEKIPWAKRNHGATLYRDGCRCDVCKEGQLKRVMKWRLTKSIMRGSSVVEYRPHKPAVRSANLLPAS